MANIQSNLKLKKEFEIRPFDVCQWQIRDFRGVHHVSHGIRKCASAGGNDGWHRETAFLGEGSGAAHFNVPHFIGNFKNH